MISYQYAAYGSNLHPDRLRRRTPSAKLIGRCFLPAYSLSFHKKSTKDGSGKCSIHDGGPGVYLAIFEINEIERKSLDLCEGLGVGYERREIQFSEFGICSTYVASPDFIDGSLAPLDWYKEYVVRGARFNGFPAEYVSLLESIRAVPDADDDRSNKEWKLINDLRGGT